MYPPGSDSIRRPGLDSTAMTSEEPGLLGNLPRSRPGTRSDKRAGAGAADGLVQEPEPAAGRKSKAAKSKPAAAKAKAPGKTEAAAKGKSKPVAKAKPRPKTTAKPRDPAPPPPTPPRPAPPRQPVAAEPRPSGGPLRSAAKVAGTGLRVAEGVTRTVLRRLPRP